VRCAGRQEAGARLTRRDLKYINISQNAHLRAEETALFLKVVLMEGSTSAKVEEEDKKKTGGRHNKCVTRNGRSFVSREQKALAPCVRPTQKHLSKPLCHPLCTLSRFSVIRQQIPPKHPHSDFQATRHFQTRVLTECPSRYRYS